MYSEIRSDERDVIAKMLADHVSTDESARGLGSGRVKIFTGSQSAQTSRNRASILLEVLMALDVPSFSH